MNSFDVELAALIEKWRGMGTSEDSLCDALEKEFDALEEKIVGSERTPT